TINDNTAIFHSNIAMSPADGDKGGSYASKENYDAKVGIHSAYGVVARGRAEDARSPGRFATGGGGRRADRHDHGSRHLLPGRGRRFRPGAHRGSQDHVARRQILL